MAPIHSFRRQKIKKTFINLLGSRYVEDIAENLSAKHLAKKLMRMYGDLEEEKGDIFVNNTGHELSGKYIKAVSRIL